MVPAVVTVEPSSSCTITVIVYGHDPMWVWLPTTQLPPGKVSIVEGVLAVPSPQLIIAQ